MSSKKYDLEERTLTYATSCKELSKRCQSSLENVEIKKQLIRSACSIGANYIEANEALSRRDFLYRIKICRKEAKESVYWLKLIDVQSHNELLRSKLVKEGTELMKIMSSIYINSSKANTG